jgi:hypothetical protein
MADEKVATFKVSEDLLRFVRDYAIRNKLDMNRALEAIINNQHYFTRTVDNGGKIIIQKPDGTLNELDFAAASSKR